MKDFVFTTPTTIYFGKCQLEKLGQIIRQYGSRALLVYGGGSIKRTGLYDTVSSLLKKSSVSVAELPGVEPNPKIGSVRKGVRLCRENGVDVVLAVGGGSSIDCAKVVAAGACYAGDPWDLVVHPELIKKALPLVTVLTIAATGSEMNGNAVITNPETREKLGTAGLALKPKASILDPELTFTVPKRQTAAGTADIMSHIFENYFNHEKGAFLQARTAEGLLRTCIHYGPVALRYPDDYEARANLMWTSSLAINGLLSCGAQINWSVHSIEHELSAFYDITHGVGLAILTPNWMKFVLNDSTAGKFAEYGVNVWGLDPKQPVRSTAEQAIKKTSEFFKSSLGLPSSLHEIGIGEENFRVMAEHAAAHGLKDAYVPLTADDVLKIYRASL